MKTIGGYLCTKALRINSSVLEFPAGGMPAGFSSLSELQPKLHVPWRLFKPDQPIVPVGLMPEQLGEQLAREIAQSVATDDEDNAKARTVFIHGFTFPKRSEPHICADTDLKKFMLPKDVYIVIMQKTSPTNFWVDFDGMGYRPEVTSVSKTKDELDHVTGDSESYWKMIKKNPKQWYRELRSMFHSNWK